MYFKLTLSLYEVKFPTDIDDVLRALARLITPGVRHLDLRDCGVPPTSLVSALDKALKAGYARLRASSGELSARTYVATSPEGPDRAARMLLEHIDELKALVRANQKPTI